MDNKSLLDKIKNLLSGESKIPDVPEEVADVREKEIERIRNLNALKCGNNSVNAIIDVAILEGKTVDEVKSYVDAVKSSAPSTDKTAQAILNLIEDNMKSGAEGVGGSAEKETDADKRKAQAALIAKFANVRG